MRKGLIYKYTNKENGKVYIGQTVGKLSVRHSKHLHDKNNTYFDRSLRKYGEEAFDLEVIESDIPFDQLDDREKYWIRYYDSFYTHGKGYNLSEGGKWGSGTQILTFDDSVKIIDLIKNPKNKFSDIAKQFGVSIYAISDINRGRSFYDKSNDYPIRKAKERSKTSPSIINEAISLLKNTNLNTEEIGQKLKIKSYTVDLINRGQLSAVKKLPLSFPIRKHEKAMTFSNILSREKIVLVCKDLCFSTLTLKEIGSKFGVAENTISDISRGLTWPEITHDFVRPIKSNANANAKIFSEIYPDLV